MREDVPNPQGPRSGCRAWRNPKHLLSCSRVSTVEQVQHNQSYSLLQGCSI